MHQDSIRWSDPTQALSDAINGYGLGPRALDLTSKIYSRVPNYILQAPLSALAKRVYGLMFTYTFRATEEKPNYFFESAENMAATLGVTERRCRRALAELTQAELIAWSDAPAPTSNSDRHYYVLYWPGHEGHLVAKHGLKPKKGPVTLPVAKKIARWVPAHNEVADVLDVLKVDRRSISVDVLVYGYVEMLCARDDNAFFQSATRAAKQLGMSRNTFTASARRLCSALLLGRHQNRLYPLAHPVWSVNAVENKDQWLNVFRQIVDYGLEPEPEIILEDL